MQFSSAFVYKVYDPFMTGFSSTEGIGLTTDRTLLCLAISYETQDSIYCPDNREPRKFSQGQETPLWRQEGKGTHSNLIFFYANQCVKHKWLKEELRTTVFHWLCTDYTCFLCIFDLLKLLAKCWLKLDRHIITSGLRYWVIPNCFNYEHMIVKITYFEIYNAILNTHYTC